MIISVCAVKLWAVGFSVYFDFSVLLIFVTGIYAALSIKLIRTLKILEDFICFSNQDKGFLHIPKWINGYSRLNMSLLSFFLSWRQQAEKLGIALSNTLPLAAANLLQHTFSLLYLLPNLTPFSPSLLAKWTDLGLEITLLWCVLLLQLLRRCPLIYRLKLPLQLHLTLYIWPLTLITSLQSVKSQSHGILKLKGTWKLFCLFLLHQKKKLRVRAIKWLPSVTELCHGKVVTGAWSWALAPLCTSHHLQPQNIHSKWFCLVDAKPLLLFCSPDAKGVCRMKTLAGGKGFGVQTLAFSWTCNGAAAES